MLDAPQRSEAWISARLGKLTASLIHGVLPGSRGAYLASRRNTMSALLCERLTEQPQQNFPITGPMMWGIEQEPSARAAYEFETGYTVDEVGFIPHPEIDMSGASPDGLVGAEGLVEIKCPNTANHLDRMAGVGIEPRYLSQMQWQMACTGRQWCDFVSYDPRLGRPALILHIERVARDPDMIALMENEARKFLSELDAKIAEIVAREEAA